MNKQKNIEKLIFDIFDKEIEGTEIYNHEGSMWLIFTEERKWVVEFTKQKTLWYNYKHFNDILMLFGMEVSDGAKYIKKWYEDKFIFNAVKQNASTLLYVDDVIDNGVKETDKSYSNYRLCVENTIQNGVKHICRGSYANTSLAEDIIQNGVKNIIDAGPDQTVCVEDTIQNGVKYMSMGFWSGRFRVEATIQNGVKEVDYYDGSAEVLVNEAIENGVKYMMSGSEFKNNQVEDIIKYSEKL